MAKRRKQERLNHGPAIWDLLYSMIGTLLLIIVLLLFAAFGVSLIYGWQVVAIITLFFLLAVFAVAAVYRRGFSAKGQWSEHGSAEVHLESENEEKSY